jgi:hypothetical protein
MGAVGSAELLWGSSAIVTENESEIAAFQKRPFDAAIAHADKTTGQFGPGARYFRVY